MARKKRRLITRRLSYLFVVLTGTLWVFFFGGVVTYSIFFLCLLMPLLSAMHLLVVRRRVGFGQALSAHLVRKQEPMRHFVCLTNMNRTMFLPALRVDFVDKEDGQITASCAVSALLPGDHAEVFSERTFRYRGQYHIALPEVHLSDFLGLLWLRCKLSGPLTVTVCPRVYVLRSCRMLFGVTPSLARQARSSSNEVSVASDSRKYQYGDPVNRIHWKLTAQKGELISRLFENEEAAEVLLLLDTTPPSGVEDPMEVADRLVEAVLAVLYYCLQYKFAVRLVHLNGPSVPGGGIFNAQQKDRASFDSLFAHLSTLVFDSADPFDMLLRHAVNPSETFAGTVVFTSALSEAHLTDVATLHTPGSPASIVYTAPDDAPLNLPVNLPFSVCVVPPGADLRAALEVEAPS